MIKNDPLQLDMGDNISEPPPPPSPSKNPAPRPHRKGTGPGQGPGGKPPVPSGEQKIRILLEDNEQIPPGGQFVQVNGRSFLIQAGYEVEVPQSVLDVLDHAVMSVPVTNQEKTVIGYRDRLRFPYRVITAQRRGGP